MFLVFHVVECWFFLGNVVRFHLLLRVTLPDAHLLLLPESPAVLTTVGPLAAQPPVVAVIVLCAAPKPEHHSISATDKLSNANS